MGPRGDRSDRGRNCPQHFCVGSPLQWGPPYSPPKYLCMLLGIRAAQTYPSKPTS